MMHELNHTQGNSVNLPIGLDRVATWLKSHERPFLLFAIVAQLGVLLSMIGLRMIPLITGETILVKVVPVDPRDFFRGDYVILGYEFSNRSKLDGIDGMPAGKSYSETMHLPVYVSLESNDEGEWHAVQYHMKPPKSGNYIRGYIASWNTIEFGIESFFVEEGTGLDYESAARSGELFAEIALTKSGKAALKSLRIKKHNPKLSSLSIIR